jgi:cell division protein ZapA
MAQVTVRINGYAYAVGCEDGQEPHLQSMAAQVERRIDRIKAIGGQSGEARLLALAALLMADELHDLAAEKLPSGTRNALAEGEQARSLVLEHTHLVTGLADRAEAIAAALERD